MSQLEYLYHRDSHGNLRVWWAEIDGDKYRTHAGLDNGAIVTSDWRTAEPKNVGRSNATTGSEQAILEVESMYQRRLERKYSKTRGTAARSNFLQPMLAATYDPKKPPKDILNFMWQPKLDGIRCLMMQEGGFSRAGKPFFTVDHILVQLQPLMEKHNAIFDGELYNHEYKNDFNKITSLVKQQKPERLSHEEITEIAEKVQFHCYDVILLDRPDATFREREQFLTEVLDDSLKSVKFVGAGWVRNSGELIDHVHGISVELGYEGAMLRDPDSVYENKRTKALLKVKQFKEEEMLVKDIQEGIGNWAGAAKTALLVTKDGIETSAGIIGPYEENARILREKETYIGGDATVKFQDYTPDGKIRFGVVKKFWGEKRDV